jgi:hypothetical protein
MASISAVPASSVHNTADAGPRSIRAIGVITSDAGGSGRPFWSALRITVDRSPAARSTDTPSFRRPSAKKTRRIANAWSVSPEAAVNARRSGAAGTHASAPRGKSKPAGMTPTTWIGSTGPSTFSLARIGDRRTLGSRPNRRCHSP